MSFDYQVFMMDGMTTNETVTVNEDGSYTIFINRNLCESKRLKAFNHAINYIKNNDFEKGNVQDIESVAHYVGAL